MALLFRRPVTLISLRALARAASAAAPLPDQASPETSTSYSDGGTVSFGYEDVRVNEKAQRVGQVFSSVAASYDTMNDLMSGGLHRLWKDRLVARLQPFAGMAHLDVAGGTGDVAFRVLRAMRGDQLLRQEEQGGDASAEGVPLGLVTVCDINPDMLAEGRRKAARAQALGEGLQWVVGDAERLPFPDASMDAYTIAFGIRNVTRIEAALAEAHRVLRRGGAFHCLEFSRLAVPGLRELYDTYSFNIIPRIGRVVANDEASYQYLVESIRRFPDQEAFAQLIRSAGFSAVSFENLSGGICAVHSGFKL